MFGLKKGKEDRPSIYGAPRTGGLVLGNGEVDGFSFPLLDELALEEKVVERAEMLKAKMGDGELDGSCVDAIRLAYAALLEELDADIAAWRAQCEITLGALENSLAMQAKAEAAGLEYGEAALGGAPPKGPTSAFSGGSA